VKSLKSQGARKERWRCCGVERPRPDRARVATEPLEKQVEDAVREHFVTSSRSLPRSARRYRAGEDQSDDDHDRAGGGRRRRRQSISNIDDPLDANLDHPPPGNRSGRRRSEPIDPSDADQGAARGRRGSARRSLLARRIAVRSMPDRRVDRRARERKSERSIRMTLSLAFLAPGFVEAAIEGRLPRGFGVTRLTDPPMAWSRQ